MRSSPRRREATLSTFPFSSDLPGKARYGTVQVRRCESRADFVMPDQRLPEPTELPTPAPVSQAERQLQSGAEAGSQEIDPMQSTTDSPVVAARTASEKQGPNQGSNPHQAPQRIPSWLRQAERFLRVIVRMYLGLLVCCAPWYPPAWDNNPLFASSPWLMTFVTYGAVRGIVSGLGILNLWIAVRDALRSTSGPDSN